MKIKHLLYILLGASISLSTVACGSSSSKDDDSSSKKEKKEKKNKKEDAAKEEAVEELAPAGETADGVCEVVNEDAFLAKLDAPKSSTMIIDCGATWCGPCQAFKPTFHAVAKEYSGNDKVEFYYVDVDNNPKIVERFNISAVPTLIVVTADGRTITNQGLMEKDDFTNLVTENL